MPSTAICASRMRPAKTPTRASTGASGSWSESYQSTRKSSATASISPEKISARCALPALRSSRAGPKIDENERASTAMKLKDFIVTNAIISDLASTDRDAALRELATALAKAEALPDSAIEEIGAALI